ncbi:MAG: hypothetical protein PHS04_00790 [Tissierellia bacterium]|nr:hypothetical protein [Tissierellia bacterium]
MSRNIKDYDSVLTKFVFANFLLLIFVPDLINISSHSNYVTYLTEVGLLKGVGLLLTSILTLLVNGLYKSEHKYIIVFWKVKNNLPGYRVFTELAKKDRRIDYNTLMSKYDPLPTEPDAQNKLWYKILKKNPNDESILQSHRDFLLFRDLATIAFSLMVVFMIVFVAAKVLNFNLGIIYFFIFAFEYILLVVITRNKAERFVLNVIATDINSE